MKIIENTINFFFPAECSVCRRILKISEKYICEKCKEEMKVIHSPYCKKCGVPISSSSPFCRDCKEERWYFHVARSAVLYEGKAEEALRLFKYGGRSELHKPIAAVMLRHITNYFDLDEFDYIIPVPLHWKKKLRRGFNQAELLVRWLSKKLYKPPLHVLKKKKEGESQAKLDRKERFGNVKGTFKVKRRNEIVDKCILLVDDVFTTGATSNECCKVLLEAGAKRISVFTFARRISQGGKV